MGHLTIVNENSNGNAVYETEWNRRVAVIVSEINKVAKTDYDKILALYNYFTSDNMKYVFIGFSPRSTTLAMPKTYSYLGGVVSQYDKYPALFFNEGVCCTYAKAFEDVAHKLGIPCLYVDGMTTMEHAWNAVLIDNQIKYIDVAFYLMGERTLNRKMNYFLKDGFVGRKQYISPDLIMSELLKQRTEFRTIVEPRKNETTPEEQRPSRIIFVDKDSNSPMPKNDDVDVNKGNITDSRTYRDVGSLLNRLKQRTERIEEVERYGQNESISSEQSNESLEFRIHR